MTLSQQRKSCLSAGRIENAPRQLETNINIRGRKDGWPQTPNARASSKRSPRDLEGRKKAYA